MTAKIMMFVAALGGFIAVALGAFGAHGLKNTLSPELLSAWQTGVQYQFYHVLALLFVAVLMLTQPSSWLVVSATAFMLGMVLFSGSLYALALGGPRWLGPVTPLGGLSFLIGWIALVVAAVKLKEGA
jgi:uncharacterized membrane protein YgdD (TMEM256/DUF423 family)